MPRVLLTAFEPFDGTGLNSSQEVVRAVAARGVAGIDLATAVLPVRFGDDLAALSPALARHRPDVLLHTGQAGRATCIAVERLAVNVRFAASEFETIRQSDAEQHLIAEDGPPAYFATVPVEGMARAIAAAGVPAAISNHAGIYLCNHLLYHSLHTAVGGGGPRAGFLHLPRLAEQWRAGGEEAPAELPTLEELVEGVVAALQALNGEG